MHKRILSVFLALALLVPFIPAFAEGGSSEIIYNVTFEDGFLGIAPSGFSVSENGNSVSTVELDCGYNGVSQRCIAFDMSEDVSAGGSCYLQRSITEFNAENFIIEWWYYPGDTVTNKQVYFRNRETNATSQFLNFNKDGYITMPSDNNRVITTYEADRWYNVQLLFRTKSQTVDFYLDGKLIAEGCASPVPGVTSFIRFTKGYSSKKMGNTYLDSIRIYTGETFLDDSAFPVPERTRGYADFYTMADGEVYMNDTFEEQFPYTTHANYYNTRNGNFSQLAPTDEGNVIKLSSTETAAEKNFYTEKLMKIFQGKAIIDLCVKPLETSSRLDLYVKDASGSQIIPFTFNGGTLYNGSTKICPYESGKWYNLVCMFDMDKDTANYFVNGEQVGAKNQSFVFSNIRSFRLYCRYEDEALYHVDNIRVYGGDKIMTEFPPKEENYDFKPVSEELAGDKLDNSVSLLVGCENAYVDGKIQIDADNVNVKPVIRNGRTLLPVRFICENLGATAEYNENERKVTIRKYNKTLEMTVGSNVAVRNGEEITLLAAPEIIENRTFLPIRDVADFLGKQVYWHDMGLVVVGDNAESLDYGKDEELIHNLIAKLLYERPTPEKIYEDVVRNNPGKSHPRIMLSAEQVEVLRDIYKNNSDAYGRQYIDDVFVYAEKYINGKLPEFSRADKDLSSTLRNRIGSLSLSYLITGDEKYKNEVWRVFKHMTTYENWQHENGIAYGEFLMAVALAYDWLYYEWTEEERAFMRNAIKELGIPNLILSYRQAAMRINPWIQKNNNFNAVGSAGVLSLCIAVMDEEELSEDMAWIASKALLGIEHSIVEVMPDGAWLEGVTYWSYTMRFAVPVLETIIRNCGTDYGLLKTPGLKTTGDFLVYTQGPTGIFNFHDAPYAKRSGSEMFTLSKLTDNLDYAMINLRYKDMTGGTGSWLELPYYTPLNATDYQITMPYDKYFRKIEIASFRSSWDDNGNFISFHGGALGGSHSEFDAGTFVIDSMGERWAFDLGPDNYSLTDYNTISQNFRHYRRRSEGHNTLVLNPSEDAGQKLGGNVVIEPVTLNGADGAAAVMDMTSAYSHQNVKSVKRGISLCENRTRFIIRDEIDAFYDTDIYWFMHTDAEVAISADGKEAMMSKNGKQMRVRVLEEGVTLSVMDAVPLETSPLSPNQNKNEGMRKIYINSSGKTATYTVVIDPITDLNKEFKAPEVLPLDMWGAK